ncbi:MAG: RNA polymerase sigma factor, partial [Oscillospiraceae bacterium]
GKLYGLCLKLCNGRSADAQDLYQETWLKAYRWHGRYNPAQSFLNWLTRICVNTYRDMLRRQKLLRFISPKEPEEQQALLDGIPDGARPEESIEVRDAVARLPEGLRLCVTLYYFYGQSTEETAGALSLPPGTVKSRLNKARALLKKELSLHE